MDLPRPKRKEELLHYCQLALIVYESLPCYCFLGYAPKLRRRCVNHCPNVSPGARELLIAAIRGEPGNAVDKIASRHQVFGRCPSWVKFLAILASSIDLPPLQDVCFEELWGAVQEFLEDHPPSLLDQLAWVSAV